MVVDFEKERRLVSDEAVSAIQAALQRAGIEFTMETEVGRGSGFQSPDVLGKNSRVD